MLRKFIALAISNVMLMSVKAQDSAAKSGTLTISGSADVYYKYDLEKTKANNLTSFTNSHNSFELGMASLKLNYKTPKTEVVADLGFGKRAQDFSYNDQGILAAVKQAYVSYLPTTWLKLTAGSWATHIGYEVVDAYLNRNYSMSYMFTNGPFFHTGIKAELTHNTSGLMIGVANPTDYKYVPDGVINRKTVLAQYSFTPGDKFKAFLNYAGGKNIDTTRSGQVDLVITSKISPKLSVGYNGTINRTKKYLGQEKFAHSKSWWGSALYLNVDPGENLGFTLRTEYFNDENRFKVYSSKGYGGSVFATTLSAIIKAGNLIVIPEIRMDRADHLLFVKENGGASKNAANILLAAIYQF